MANGPKPFVQAACVCEKVLQEVDGVPSLIRIVDTYTIDVPKNLPPGFKLATHLTAFVSLKSGDVIGQFDVGLRLNQPNGKVHPTKTWTVEFKGGEQGANLRIEFALESAIVGLYWLDVLWGEEALTRIPFRLRTRSESTSEQASNESSLS